MVGIVHPVGQNASETEKVDSHAFPHALHLIYMLFVLPIKFDLHFHFTT